MTTPTMTTWICTGFQGVEPTGTAAVIVAETAEQAAQMLNDELIRRGTITALPQDHRRVSPTEMKQLDTSKSLCLILCDGDY